LPVTAEAKTIAVLFRIVPPKIGQMESSYAGGVVAK
jgi:hypothetical protein